MGTWNISPLPKNSISSCWHANRFEGWRSYNRKTSEKQTKAFDTGMPNRIIYPCLSSIYFIPYWFNFLFHFWHCFTGNGWKTGKRTSCCQICRMLSLNTKGTQERIWWSNPCGVRAARTNKETKMLHIVIQIQSLYILSRQSST